LAVVALVAAAVAAGCGSAANRPASEPSTTSGLGGKVVLVNTRGEWLTVTVRFENHSKGKRLKWPGFGGIGDEFGNSFSMAPRELHGSLFPTGDWVNPGESVDVEFVFEHPLPTSKNLTLTLGNLSGITLSDVIQLKIRR
jgi:hypothetical protein